MSDSSRKENKKKALANFKKIKPFLENPKEVKAMLKKEYEHPVWTDIKTAHKITVEPVKKKIKNITGGIKHTLKYLRNPKDRKFLGHTDNTKK
jgi:hypothetical protein